MIDSEIKNPYGSSLYGLHYAVFLLYLFQHGLFHNLTRVMLSISMREGFDSFKLPGALAESAFL